MHEWHDVMEEPAMLIRLVVVDGLKKANGNEV